MPKLDNRLKTVAYQIRGGVHADIGSDHGHLLKALLASGRIEHGIAIENKQQPFQNSRLTLQGFDADVRFADGLAGIQPGEADSLSLCGMGGDLINRILNAYPDRVPSKVIAQPNARPELVRRWGLSNQFHLVEEHFVPGQKSFIVLCFQRDETGTPDPAYANQDQRVGELFGPHLIERWQADYVDGLCDERSYLTRFERLTDVSRFRLEMLSQLLDQNDATESGLTE